MPLRPARAMRRGVVGAPVLAPPRWSAPQPSSATASTAAKTVATIGATAAEISTSSPPRLLRPVVGAVSER